MSKNCYLVTGANGFIGSILCTELSRRGQAVHAVMHSVNPGMEASKAAAIGQINGNTDWSGALQGVDVIIHLAARVHVMKDTAADPLAAFLETNLHGTENLARQAAQAGVKRLVYVSSIKVNGESASPTQPFTEQNVPNPQDPYAISKWRAEQALHRISHETGLEVVIVRPPLVYGPGVKGNFASLMAAIDRGMPLPLASADNARSLVYAGNLADALIACATHPAAAGQTYLVSDGENVSTALLIKKIAQALGRQDHSFSLPPGLLHAAAMLLGRTKQADRLLGSLCVNSRKIRDELNWTTPYSLEQGLLATADWYRTLRNRYNRATS